MSLANVRFNTRTMQPQAFRNPCNEVGDGRRALIHIGDNAPTPLSPKPSVSSR